jgi:hypothetical protein
MEIALVLLLLLVVAGVVGGHPSAELTGDTQTPYKPPPQGNLGCPTCGSRDPKWTVLEPYTGMGTEVVPGDPIRDCPDPFHR